MPTRDTAPIGAPCWVDLFTTDAGVAQRFYGSLFGWDAEVGGPEFGGYITFHRDGVPVAGCMGSPDPEHPANFWSVYLAVTDIAATADAAAGAGGQVILPPMPVADIGHMGMVTDPSGAAIGLWQAETFGGFGVLAEPGAPAWFELHTQGYESALPFYRDVFGWDLHTMSDAPEFRYTTLGEGDDQLAGIMDTTVWTDPDPSHWAVYFATADTDASVAKALELGGSLVQPAEDTPYGRLAVVTDDQGAPFRLVQDDA